MFEKERKHSILFYITTETVEEIVQVESPSVLSGQVEDTLGRQGSCLNPSLFVGYC